MSQKRRAADDSVKPVNNKRIQTLTQNPPAVSSSPSQNVNVKKPKFISYLETPNLPQRIKTLCEILANYPSAAVEKALDESGIRIEAEDVEEVLKLSYAFPGPATKFFRWAGVCLDDNHTPYAWNLVVDLLGKNNMFDAMWGAIKSMKSKELVSHATFASVFSSYVVANRVNEALMAFEVMKQYGIPHDVIALNSLLSAICRDGKTAMAEEFFHSAKEKIPPNGDTYAILLEGWENEGNVMSARKAFGEMVIQVGWESSNVPAYDSFLNTLLKGPNGVNSAMDFFDVMKQKGCSPGLRFFKAALEEYVKTGNVRSAKLVFMWEEIVGKEGYVPDAQMYNLIIVILCHLNELDMAFRFIDEMIYYGVFPDSEAYNMLLQFCIRNKRSQAASFVFNEMVKNEFLPNLVNCEMAIGYCLDNRDSEMAIRVWKCMTKNDIMPLEDSGNMLVVGLEAIGKHPEACKYAEDMIDKGILNSSSLSKLKAGLLKAGKEDAYSKLVRNWKTSRK